MQAWLMESGTNCNREDGPKSHAQFAVGNCRPEVIPSVLRASQTAAAGFAPSVIKDLWNGRLPEMIRPRARHSAVLITAVSRECYVRSLFRPPVANGFGMT